MVSSAEPRRKRTSRVRSCIYLSLIYCTNSVSVQSFFLGNCQQFVNPGEENRSDSTTIPTQMAPRAPPKASTSALPPPVTAPKSRKRRTTEEEVPITATVDSLGLGDEALAFGSEGEEEENDMSGDEGEEEGEETFPELDFGESEDDGDFSGEGEGSEDDDSEDESLGSVDPDEEAALLAEIEAEDALGLSSSEEEDPSDLDELIRRNTTKPHEGDTPSTSYEDPAMLKDYMRRSRTVISEITGTEKTQWDEEIEAGYGSDSSTEEVSCLLLCFTASRLNHMFHWTLLITRFA